MSMKLYVGNLVFQTSNKDLQEFFARANRVESANVDMDRESGQPRRFGFVEMSSKEAGEAAIRQFQVKTLKGRVMNLTEVKRETRDGVSNRSVSDSRGETADDVAFIEIASEDDVRALPNAAQIIFGAEQDEEVARYFTEITESRERARKTQTEINRVKKKTLAILDTLS